MEFGGREAEAATHQESTKRGELMAPELPARWQGGPSSLLFNSMLSLTLINLLPAGHMLAFLYTWLAYSFPTQLEVLLCQFTNMKAESSRVTAPPAETCSQLYGK